MCFVQLRIDYKILEIILHEFNAIETRTRHAMPYHTKPYYAIALETEKRTK